MKHHTKDKGDIGLGFILADLMDHDIHVALPISEHLPFDCIAISSDLQMKRVSVKFRNMHKNTLSVKLKSVWSDRHGTHIKIHDKTSYDCIAVYCPNTRSCYYVRMDEIEGFDLLLRISPAKNHQVKHIKYAEDFANPERIFAPVLAPSSKRVGA